MNASDLVAELAKASGLSNLKLNEHGVARLAFDKGTEVDLEEDSAEGVLHLYTRVMTVPAEGKEALYSRLLEANLYCAETAGATLAVDGARNEVVLCRRLELASTDFTGFSQSLEKLVSACEALREELGAGAVTANATPPTSGAETFRVDPAAQWA
ncbi:type III secretion system chaperone [Noviherbaspirillum sp. CPCC 100848]|uniref:Type III secretion system chaperone n=1 Tax=Noviherbaspirillum album TaxID=3080276 RepID=A0ABU6JBW9_9BURK|nr:type III secretion system chaperone [Noviherbaspirillum sp. CPCC 100848]MEC4720747.1 type III secretion system chaperone [Noviherbaspirillum sp. CPCC 100848]